MPRSSKTSQNKQTVKKITSQKKERTAKKKKKELGKSKQKQEKRERKTERLRDRTSEYYKCIGRNKMVGAEHTKTF